jgi:hypothetical protein
MAPKYLFRIQFFTLAAALGLGCGSDDSPDMAAPLGTADAQVVGGGSDASGATGPTGGGSTANDAGGGTPGANNDAGGGGSPGARADAGTSGNPGGSSDAGGGASDAGGGRDATTANDARVQDSGSTGGGSTDGGGSATRFSFFVTSEASIRELSANPEGFGGDLRYGETGAGAGLRGADKLCSTIAERSLPGAGAKQWRAFLSASTGGADGGAVNARDRIGSGPWYDRKGRLVGNALADLISGSRPSMADMQIRDDLPNETGTGNRAPDGTAVDNHDTLTGSDTNGRYVSGSSTCSDWTSSASADGGGSGGPSIGHSWPRTASMGMHWVSEHKAGGCGRGINTMNGSTYGTATVGSGGGYGGFYCFALTP